MAITFGVVNSEVPLQVALTYSSINGFRYGRLTFLLVREDTRPGRQ
jgi:hypothetical protein